MGYCKAQAISFGVGAFRFAGMRQAVGWHTDCQFLIMDLIRLERKDGQEVYIPMQQTWILVSNMIGNDRHERKRKKKRNKKFTVIELTPYYFS